MLEYSNFNLEYFISAYLNLEFEYSNLKFENFPISKLEYSNSKFEYGDIPIYRWTHSMNINCYTKFNLPDRVSFVTFAPSKYGAKMYIQNSASLTCLAILWKTEVTFDKN